MQAYLLHTTLPLLGNVFVEVHQHELVDVLGLHTSISATGRTCYHLANGFLKRRMQGIQITYNKKLAIPRFAQHQALHTGLAIAIGLLREPDVLQYPVGHIVKGQG